MHCNPSSNMISALLSVALLSFVLPAAQAGWPRWGAAPGWGLHATRCMAGLQAAAPLPQHGALASPCRLALDHHAITRAHTRAAHPSGPHGRTTPGWHAGWCTPATGAQCRWSAATACRWGEALAACAAGLGEGHALHVRHHATSGRGSESATAMPTQGRRVAERWPRHQPHGAPALLPQPHG